MFVEVQREESHRSVIIRGSSSTIYENSALVATEAAKVAANAGGQGISKKAGGKGKIWCDDCNKQ